MDPILQLLTQPLVLLLIAIAVFVGRVFYLARHLRSAARSPTLADLRALEEAKRSLDQHHESLEEARGTLTTNLGGARDTLRRYKGPLNVAISGRRRDLEDRMKSLDAKRELEKVRNQSAFNDARRLYKTALPRKTHREPAKEM